MITLPENRIRPQSQISVLEPLLYVILALILSSHIFKYFNFVGHDIWYVRIAENIMAGNGVCVNPGEPYVDHPPFYPLGIGLVNLFLRNPELSGHWVSIVSFSLCAIPLFLLAHAAYGRQAAHGSSFLFATHGFLLADSSMILPENLFILLVLFEFYFAHRIIQGNGGSREACLIGLLGAFAYLSRTDGLLFFAAVLLALISLAPAPFFKRLKLALLAGIVFLPFFLGYFAFLYHSTRQVQLSGVVNELFIRRQFNVRDPKQLLEGRKIYEGLTEDKTRLKLEELEENFNLMHYLTQDHFALLKSGFTSIPARLMEMNKYLYAGLGYFFVGASFFGAVWDEKRKKSEWLFLIMLLTIVPQFFGVFYPKRYALYFPLFLMWVGNGIERFRLWSLSTFPASKKARYLPVFVVFLVMSIFSASYLRYVLQHANRMRENKELGLWMKNNIPEIREERIASRHPSVVFYSGGKILHPPYLPYVERMEDLRVYMKHQKARYFVVSDDLEQPTRDAYRSLLDEDKPLPPGIIRKFTVQGKNKAALFEIANDARPAL